jgi:hypothetical protein
VGEAEVVVSPWLVWASCAYGLVVKMEVVPVVRAPASWPAVRRKGRFGWRQAFSLPLRW